MRALSLLLVAAIVTPLIGQTPSPPDWTAAQDETMRHFQALIRFDTTDPPGGEKPAADYLKSVLDKEGIPTEVFALEPHRPNIVARLKG
ncbi:MAG: peptidase M20, partial [Vicinamibacterales bacterium]